MARIVWDAIGEKKFEVGVDHCVLFIQDTATGEYTNGVAWNGITSISETPEGAEPNNQYADNIKYLSLMSAEELNGTIEALMYPDEWNQCDGNAEALPGVVIGQQGRKTFGLCYRTKIGNDVDNENHGFKYHFLYGAKVSPSERTYETINDSPEPIGFSWEYTTTPVNVTGFQPTALITIDSTKIADQSKLTALLDIVYGGPETTEPGEPSVPDTGGGDDARAASAEESTARLPLPDELINLLKGETGAAYTARKAQMIRTRR